MDNIGIVQSDKAEPEYWEAQLRSNLVYTGPLEESIVTWNNWGITAESKTMDNEYRTPCS